MDTKMVTKEKATDKLHNLEELRRATRRVIKGRNLKVFATIVKRRVTSPKISGPRKSKAMWQPPKKEMENEWDAKLLCTVEEDELTHMTMMGEYTDYENDWNIDSE